MILHLEECSDSRSSVEVFFLQEISGRLIYKVPLRGRPSLCPEKTGFDNTVVPGHTVNGSYDGGQIWRDQFREIRARRNVVDALVSVISKVIRWPNRVEIKTNLLDLKRTRGFLNVIEALDGTYIKINIFQN